MSGWLRTSIAMALLLAAAHPAAAQTVRGQVLDRNSGQPAAGVVVLLLGVDDRAVAQGITDSRGEYRLLAGAGGEYRVRTLRIGYRPATSPVFRVAAGAEIELAPLHAGAAVALDTVRVVGRNSCAVVTGGAATFALWEQARTALTAAQITARASLVSARIVTYQRALDPARGDIRSHTAALRSGITVRPWHSLTPDSLHRVGYVVLDEQNWLNYYAPDLDVLLSDRFLEDHCFRIAPESDRSRVGIAFEPTRERRDLPEIRGTLWLDRATAQLRRLDFTYDNIDRAVMDAGAGGSVDFAPLASGLWVVSRWSIRMPVVERRYEAAGIRSRARLLRMDVTEIREEGGVLGLVTRGSDTLFATRPLEVSGIVTDSGTAATVADARLQLRGTNLSARTDSAGAFRLTGVLPGRYLLDVRSPALEAFGAMHTLTLIVTDTSERRRIQLPAAERLADRACPRTAEPGVVVGTVWRRSDSLPAPRARVVAEFRQPVVEANVLAERSRWLTVTSDLHGRYRLCGAPVDRLMLLTAELDSAASAPVEVRIPAGQRVVASDLLVDRRLVRPAAFAGVVMSDVDGAPLPDVQVVIPAVPRNAFTDADGSFRLSNIPPGTYDVQVRKLGFRQSEMKLTFAANQTLERRLLLSRVATLEAVTVRERPLLPSFEEHRKLGLGHFWDRAELAKMEGRSLSSVVNQTPGTKVVGGGNAAWLSSMRTVGSAFDPRKMCPPLEGIAPGFRSACGCYLAVYLDNMPLYTGRDGDEVPNLNSIPLSSIEAIEVYSGPAQTPAKYSTLNSHCGVLVIHTRKTLDPD